MTGRRSRAGKDSGSKTSTRAVDPVLPDSAPGGAPSGRPTRRQILLAAALAAVTVVAAVGGHLLWRRSAATAANAAPATFAGSETCAGCHRSQADLWRGSQHQRAMDHASDKSVLGDFNDASFEYYGVRSRFFRRDGKFLVETDGPDGKLATFEI